MAVTNTRRLAGAAAHEPPGAGHRRPLGRLRLARRRRRRRGRRARRDGRGDRAVLRRARRVGRAVEAGGPDGRERQAHPPRRGRGAPRPRSARASAAWTSATTRCRSTPTRSTQIADAIRAFAPDVLITHTDRDPFNPDHPVAFTAVDRARGLAAGAGRAERASPPSRRRRSSSSSPTSPSCATSPRRPSSTSRSVIERKQAAMARDEGAELPADLLRPARRAARQPRAARLGRQRRSSTPRPSSA